MSDIQIHNYDSGPGPDGAEATWDTEGLQRDFIVEAFCAPVVVVTRRSDGAKGTLMFRHNPRVYYGFQAD